jgi:hypothetical protein
MIIRPNREIRTVTEKQNMWITCVVPRLGLGELYARIPATERAESKQRGHMLCVHCTGGAGLFPRILKHGRHDSTENHIYPLGENILYLTCYHATISKKLNSKWQKMLEQICRCSQDISVQSVWFSKP